MYQKNRWHGERKTIRSPYVMHSSREIIGLKGQSTPVQKVVQKTARGYLYVEEPSRRKQEKLKLDNRA